MKTLRFKYCNKRITTCDDGNIQYHDQGQFKLNSTFNANSYVHTLTNDKIRKDLFNKNKVATIKKR